MKIKYKKVTFNLPFGGYGTYVQKMFKVGDEWVTIKQVNSPVVEDRYLFKDMSAKELYKKLNNNS